MHTSQQHPYFYFDALQALRERRAMDDGERRSLMAHIVLNAADPQAAAEYANLDNADWQHFYPAAEAPAPITTNDAISTFLEQYGHQSAEEDALLERMIFNPTPEYQIDADGLSADAPADAQDALIDSFMALHPLAADAPTPHEEKMPAPDVKAAENEPAKPAPAQSEKTAPAPGAEGPDTSLSESLARIFIKQGKYERAFEIISSLNLNNPKKSVYFADQLRFLQKLIEIDRQRAQKSAGSTNQ